MKSVVQAAWLLTTALGDVIVVIVAGVKLFNQVCAYLCRLMQSRGVRRPSVRCVRPSVCQ